jgi:hypothetical protein
MLRIVWNNSSESPWMEWLKIASSAIAPALPYYRPSMDICIFRTSHIRVGRMLRIVCNNSGALSFAYAITQ